MGPGAEEEDEGLDYSRFGDSEDNDVAHRQTPARQTGAKDSWISRSAMCLDDDDSSPPQPPDDELASSISADDAASSVSGSIEWPSSAPVVSVHAENMPGWNRKHMGDGVVSRPPLFSQGTSSNSTWQNFNEVDEKQRQCCPVRTQVWNVPAELLDVDGKRFRHFSTPHSNPDRAHNIAALLGMAFTGTSKGFLCAATTPLFRAAA
tara:strand:- start:1027 stop:1644 length:618 start_codon:yes stop_codon:yes gene_type:complete